MKKIAALCLTLVLSLCSLTAFAATLEDVQKAGKLVIATSPDFPPFESLGDDGEVVGIEVDILKKICEELGVEMVIEQMDFESVLPGVQAGKYDVGMSGISITEKRQKNALFTDPYCLAAQAIVVVEGSSIAGKADLEGKKISVQTGTTAESFCMENGYDVSSFAANNDAETALVKGKVDAWVIDDLTAADMVAAYNAENETKLVILSEAMTTEPYAFAFKQGSDDLVAKINEILSALVADGTVAELFTQYEAPYTSPLTEE
ncbi:MAG: transporter substrate-binding domain-containing protein [bacterium]|nr:transporter substrate-binding domain-containing protein [bacterium]